MAQYCCKWNGHIHNLLTGMENLRAGENYADVTLMSEGKALKAHKFVLSICSALFHDMFSSNPCSHPIIILQDMKFSTLQAIVHFIYHGEISVQQDELELLLKAGKTLGVKGMTDVCKDVLLEAIISDIEAGIQNENPSVNNASTDTTCQQKKAKKRPHDSCSDKSGDELCLTKENNSPQTEPNAQSPEKSAFSVIHTSSLPSDKESVQTVTNSVTGIASNKKNAATDYEENPTPGKPLNFRKPQRKRATPLSSKQADDSDADSEYNDEPKTKRKSYIWDFFTPLNDSIAECNTCLVNKSYKSSISNLKKHLRAKHPSVELFYPNAKETSAMQSITTEEDQLGLQSASPMQTMASFEHRPLMSRKEAFARKKTSYIWKYFTPTDNMIAVCNACSASKSYRSSISNLKKHLQRRHPSIDLPSASQDDGIDQVNPEQAEPREEDSMAARPIKRRRSKLAGQKKSFIWNYFTPQSDTMAECNICSKSKSYKSSISNLKAHLSKKHPTIDLVSAQELQEYAIAHRFQPRIGTVRTITAVETLSAATNESMQSMSVDTTLSNGETVSMPVYFQIVEA